MTPAKIIKLLDGKAYIEIAEDYIRIGADASNSLIINEAGIHLQSNKVNLETEPENMTFRGIVNNISTLPGLLPFGPKYIINDKPLKGLSTIATSMLAIRKAVGI